MKPIQGNFNQNEYILLHPVIERNNELVRKWSVYRILTLVTLGLRSQRDFFKFFKKYFFFESLSIATAERKRALKMRNKRRK